MYKELSGGDMNDILEMAKNTPLKKRHIDKLERMLPTEEFEMLDL